jgi:hypothetical protein
MKTSPPTTTRADIYLLNEARPALELGGLIFVQSGAVHLQTCRLQPPLPATAVESRSRVPSDASRGRSQRAGFVTMRKTMTITSIARIAPTTVPRLDARLNSSDVGPASSYARICARSVGE